MNKNMGERKKDVAIIEGGCRGAGTVIITEDARAQECKNNNRLGSVAAITLRYHFMVSGRKQMHQPWRIRLLI